MKTVLFDLYGTLVDIHTDENQDSFWNTVTNWFADHGAVYAPAELKKAYKALIEDETRTLSAGPRYSHESFPEIEIEGVFQALYDAKGAKWDDALITETARFFRKASTDYIRLYPHAVELLKNLKDAGYQVILLSNAQKVFTMSELEGLGIVDLFDNIYISSEYQVKKPDIAFFKLPIEQYHLDPDQTIMVGNDMECDIQGAKNAGLHTLYIDSNISPAFTENKAEYFLDHMDLQAAEKILMDLKNA